MNAILGVIVLYGLIHVLKIEGQERLERKLNLEIYMTERATDRCHELGVAPAKMRQCIEQMTEHIDDISPLNRRKYEAEQVAKT